MNLFITLIFAILLNLSCYATSELQFYKSEDLLKSLSFEELKSSFKIHKVTVFNPYTLKPETYNAFSMRRILQSIYKDEWKDQFALTVRTKDRYTPIVETYKFKEREAYLAFSRADNKKFVSLTMYKEKVVDLSPYYLIWEEDKNKVPSRRKSHWPYKVIGFELISKIPTFIIPPEKDQKLNWGYENVRKNCLSCHTVYGYGSTKVSELITNGTTKRYSDKKLAQFIHNPRGINPKSKMPKFSPKIDKRVDRIKNIVLYLRYLEEKKKIKREKSTKSLIKAIEKQIN